jgi:hypothetical protein
METSILVTIYQNRKGMLKYKTSIEENDSFKTLSFLRRWNSGTIIHVKKKKKYYGPLAILKEKKKDLLLLIPSIFHKFYRELKTTNDTQDYDPDLIDEDTIDRE